MKLILVPYKSCTEEFQVQLWEFCKAMLVSQKQQQFQAIGILLVLILVQFCDGQCFILYSMFYSFILYSIFSICFYLFY